MNIAFRAALVGTIVASTVSASAQPVSLVLRQGTPVNLKNRFELNTKSVKAGDRFEVDVAEDVKVGQAVVIPAGTHGVGEITRAERNGHFGKSGKLETRILYLDLGGQHVEMDGQTSEKGKGGTAGTVAAIVGFGVVGIFVHGTSAKLNAGAAMTAYVHSDIPISFAAAPSQAVLVVPGSATLPALAATASIPIQNAVVVAPVTAASPSPAPSTTLVAPAAKLVPIATHQ